MTAATAKALFRTMLREAKNMNDYNFRMYGIRRVKAGFRKQQGLQGDEAAAALLEGQKQLAVLQRQVIMGKLYPSAQSVME